MRKNISDLFQKMIMIAINHQHFLEESFKSPLITLTQDLVTQLDNTIGLANYGFNEVEELQKLVNTKCIAIKYGYSLDQKELEKILSNQSEENLEKCLYMTFYNKTIQAGSIASLLADSFHSESALSDCTLADIADELYVYCANGGDLEELFNLVKKEFKKMAKD